VEAIAGALAHPSAAPVASAGRSQSRIERAFTLGTLSAGAHRRQRHAESMSWLGVYQAWESPQWGQATVVDTGASNTMPHWHV
jgi:hypothetical protein